MRKKEEKRTACFKNQRRGQSKSVTTFVDHSKKMMLYTERNIDAHEGIQEELERLAPEAVVYLDKSGREEAIGQSPRRTQA